MTTPQERFSRSLARIREFFDSQKPPYKDVVLQQQLFELQRLERLIFSAKDALKDILGDAELEPGEGIYTLAARLYKGNSAIDCICGNCSAFQPTKNLECQFCGIQLAANPARYGNVTVDKDFRLGYGADKFKTNTTPRLKEPEEWKNLPIINAAEIKKRERKKPVKTKVNEFRSWLRRKAICERFPFSLDDLGSFNQHDIQAITAAVASLIPTMTREERAALATANIGFLRNWVYENQPQAPVELKYDKSSGFGYKDLDFIRAERRKRKRDGGNG